MVGSLTLMLTDGGPKSEWTALTVNWKLKTSSRAFILIADEDKVPMYAVYRANADELNDQFLQSLKTAFKDKQVEIVVSEVDETEYLLRSPANRARLLKAVEDVEQGRNLVVPDPGLFR